MDSAKSWRGKELFKVFDTDWEVYNYLTVHGLAAFSHVAQGAQLPVSNSAQGDSSNVTLQHYGGRVSITKTLRLFERYDTMESLVKSAVKHAFNRIDQSMADVLLNGFIGSTYTDVYGNTVSNTAPDGVVFFSASHTNNINADTFRNLIRNAAATVNPALDRDPMIKARADAHLYLDPNDTNLPIELDTLIVGANNADLAERIIYSQGIQNTPNVDINPLKGKVSKLLVWPKLDLRTGGTDTKAYWFMADSSMVGETLLAPFAQPVRMGEAFNVNDTLNWEYPIDAYYALLIGHPAFVWGSTGVN